MLIKIAYILLAIAVSCAISWVIEITRRKDWGPLVSIPMLLIGLLSMVGLGIRVFGG